MPEKDGRHADLVERVLEVIQNEADPVRHTSQEELFEGRSLTELLDIAEALERLRIRSHNLYHRVRACMLLYIVYQFYIIGREDVQKVGHMPFNGVKLALDRQYADAIDVIRTEMEDQGLNEALVSALAEAYHGLTFKYLVDQVRVSISTFQGNRQLFTTESLRDYHYRVPPVLMKKDQTTAIYPAVEDKSPVRADPCHSGWSDIFFLGMDYPEGARVVNVSVDLAVRGRDDGVRPPIECHCRRIDRPCIRLVSVDLKTHKDVDSLEELFNFGNDYLSLLKAAVVASGIVPPCFEDRHVELSEILEKLFGEAGVGFELVSIVHGIPKGSRLAVSTSLLASLITCLMRFSGQIKTIDGPLSEENRRLVASRAILGEWLGGSGGGWQDSGALWPGFKVINGVLAGRGDPEHGVSRGCLLPTHHVLDEEGLAPENRKKFMESVVIVHGGMAQDVGPILEMVTEKYLTRASREWYARLHGYKLFDGTVEAIRLGNMQQLGRLTDEDWEKVTKVIIPWVDNKYTDQINERLRKQFGDDLYGFLMLGGMAGGGMAYIVNPKRREKFCKAVAATMSELQSELREVVPFSMDPVVYDFRVSETGSCGRLRSGPEALLPDEYYIYIETESAHGRAAQWAKDHEAELELFAKQSGGSAFGTKRTGTQISSITSNCEEWDKRVEQITAASGFDPEYHEQMRAQLVAGKIGLARNRLSAEATVIEDVEPGDVRLVPTRFDYRRFARFERIGREAELNGEIAVVTLCAGLGSRWMHGAGTVKALNPFVRMHGTFRSFAEIHLAKTRKWSQQRERPLQHVFTTSFLTLPAFEKHLAVTDNFGYDGPLYLSRAQSVGHRVYPMERDLRFLWQETAQQRLSDRAQKVLDDVHEALIEWTRSRGEGQDYHENLPEQRLYPPGHWYEIPNMLLNGTLARMINDNPNLKYLLVHNVDTLGVAIDSVILGMHVDSGMTFSLEVIPRRIEDRGGGLARINGRLSLLEGLAQPREEDEYKLSYYNTLTNCLTIDSLLAMFALTRDDIVNALTKPAARDKVRNAVHAAADRMPVYVTIRDVKLRWGAGQEDIYPIAQWERLWGDMTRLPDCAAEYIVVPRMRGQQLKNPAHLDRWANDGSKDYVESFVEFAY